MATDMLRGMSTEDPDNHCRANIKDSVIDHVMFNFDDHGMQVDTLDSLGSAADEQLSGLPDPQASTSKRPYRSRRMETFLETTEQIWEQQSISEQQPQRPSKRRRTRKKRLPAAMGGKPVPTEARRLKTPSVCQKCGAKKFEYESKGLCCCDGDVDQVSNEYPEALLQLFTARDEMSLQFQKYSRLYNNVFAFTSLGGSFDSKTESGIYVFKAHGQVYHNLPNLIPMDNIPRYLQLYFYDGEHEKNNRLGLFKELREDTTTLLMGLMDANPYGSSMFPVSAATDDDPQSLIEAEVALAARRYTRADKRISCREYYAYKFKIRPGNLLLRGGRLFQQYIVDMYVKIENTRLDFFRLNQDAIRADLYQGILDTLELGESSAANVGKRMILPPSFLGSPRDMKRRYLHAIALVQKYGKPDLFLTITCNPNWPEIKAELANGELAQNRPDLVARVFNAKLTALRKEIMGKQIFGEVAAIINVVEFQKRGLPHAHFLIILKPDHKIKNPECFDKYVCAEIPSEDNPHLRSAVLRHMMHGPCGIDFPKCKCMKVKGRKMVCTSGYPKKNSEFTTNGSDSYPLYRRRSTGEKVVVRKLAMDNTWVVPYNPYLLAMFDCHLNVEVCSTIKAVKYLYKYVYKGHDRIQFNISGAGQNAVVDETERYQSGRWVSPPEAAWRIFGFNLFDIYPPVLPLPVHTPNSQFVSFQAHESLEGIIVDEHRTKTMLTEFFRKNSLQKEGPKYLYREFPKHFVWLKQQKIWKARERGVVIGRVAHASPAEGEMYYLRLLLAHVRGPTSFEDLLTIDGVKSASFQEAALKRGLLEHDNVGDSCMEEAVQVEMPHALRRLFATILIFSRPNNPSDFWDKYYNALSEDFRKEFQHNEQMILHLTAGKIGQFLEGMGKTFAGFNLHHLQVAQDSVVNNTRDVTDALNAPVPMEQLASRKELNGGTGKPFLYGALYAKVRSMGKICLATASSGVAASNLPTGRTCHSQFKIPLDTEETMTCDVPKQGSLACLLRETSLIIWDEASMAKRDSIQAVNFLLQDVYSNSETFGGKIVVFGGDFCQVLPVLPRRTQQEAVEASIVSSELWNSLIKFRLTENIRARAYTEFSNFLLKLGNGELQTTEDGVVQLPPDLILEANETQCPLTVLVESVFPEVQQTDFSPSIFTGRAILTPRNNDVDSINALLIDKFPGKEYVYKSFDSVIDDNSNVYPAEFLNTLCPPGMTPHELVVKENSPAILFRNIDPAAGLCNGTRLICKRFYPNMIKCKISTGYYTGERVFLPRITLRPSRSSKFPINFQRRQFPIKLSFAMTINKAQGQTLERVGIYLPKPCFSHGQLYVALSRARTAQQLKVLHGRDTEDGQATSVKNKTMKSPKMLVKDLTDKSGPYSIKLKVINKTNAQTSPTNKSVLFQRITFEDEEGGKIKTTLYNDEIMAYEDVIHDRMEYEISDAKLKPVPEKYRTNVDDHPFQLSFTNNTLIQQIGSSPPPGPQYVALGSIPRALRDADRYDALGILIYIDDVRQVPRQSGPTVDVCEIIIVDRSTAHPMIITVWADLVTKECAALRDIVQEFPIIGLTSLKPSYHKESLMSFSTLLKFGALSFDTRFSLSTTTSTFIKLEPEGEMAESLRSWAKENHEVVEVKQGQVLKVRLPDTRRIITSIKNLRNKKASDTLQEERH
ncbi:uncharacterized protein LOC141648664 [Silene latifolia]|uniref:uncharacterized protein LOC141648664 n=1 Tax=Silene latifolia TaxID=37657 RepID=UPI003D784EE3